MTDEPRSPHPSGDATSTEGADQSTVAALDADPDPDLAPSPSDGFGSGEPTPEPVAAKPSPLGRLGHFAREIVIVVVVALVASALLRAFVVQAFFVPSGSMLPEINLNDRILVSRIGDIERGEVVVFEDPGNWIPSSEQAEPPTGVRKVMEFIGVLPASGHEHLVKRVIGLPGDRVICCVDGKLTINGVEVDESDFIKPGDKKADNVFFDVLVPADHIFVLGDNRYVSGDSSRHPNGQEAFVPVDLVTGRAFAVIWPRENMHILRIPDAYADVPDGQTPPDEGVFTQPTQGAR